MSNIQNMNFTILSTTLVETLSRRMHEFWGVNLFRTFRDVVENSLPIWTRVNGKKS